MHDFQALQITKVTRETPQAISVTLEVPETLRNAFAFRPGQHLAVRATLEGEELRRTYSICSGPDDRDLTIAIKQIDGGRYSTWAGSNLTPGGTLDVMPPAGRFVLSPSNGTPRHIVGFAAGAGITPIIAIIKHALAREPESTVTLVFGNRSTEAILFREALEDLKDRHLRRFTLLHVLSRNEDSASPLFEGRITGATVRALWPRLVAAGDNVEAFLCGPGTLIKDVRNALFELGVPRDRVHHEFFAAGGGAYQARPATPQPAPLATGTTEVTAIVDGIRHRFLAQPGQRVVDAAIEAGVRVPYSCKGGMCSTCRAKVVDGKASMAVNYSLEPWETGQGFILTCQAVADGPTLVVDYDQM